MNKYRKGFTMIATTTTPPLKSSIRLDLTETKHNKKNAVIFGRRTWNYISIDTQKQLCNNGRELIVLSRSLLHSTYANQIHNNFNRAIHTCLNDSNIDQTFVIGGHEIYNQAIVDARLLDVYWTELLNKKEDIQAPHEDFFYLVNSSHILYDDHCDCYFKHRRYVKRTIPNI